MGGTTGVGGGTSTAETDTRIFAAAVASAGAANCVLFEGDSITAASPTLYGANGEWPKLLQGLRKDVVPCNIAFGGKNTTQALARFEAAVDRLRLDHVIHDVVILIGINNTLIGKNPARTAADILHLADKAVAKGLTPHILTLTPATANVYAQAYSRDVTNELVIQNASARHDLRHLRDKFTETLWSSCSEDGIHPGGPSSGAPCRVAIAGFVASWLPKQDRARGDVRVGRPDRTMPLQWPGHAGIPSRLDDGQPRVDGGLGAEPLRFRAMAAPNRWWRANGQSRRDEDGEGDGSVESSGAQGRN